MLILNLLEYSQNYSMTSENLWNYYRAEIDDGNDDTLDGKSFKYKTKNSNKNTAKTKTTITTISRLRWKSTARAITTTSTSFKY